MKKPAVVPKPEPGGKAAAEQSRPKAKTAQARPVAAKKTARKPRQKKKQGVTRQILLLAGLEIAALAACAITAIVVLLGYAAHRFTGTEFFPHLLPFTLGVLGLIVTTALLLTGWLRLRRWLQAQSKLLPALIALGLALTIGSLTVRGDFFDNFRHFRTMIGGKAEASRVTLSHQVFASYRRLDPRQLQQLIDRSRPYSKDIDDAAQAFGLDPDLLHGVAATESSYLPRESKDGGHGLFQITQVPDSAQVKAGRALGVDQPSRADHRHNGYIAAATLEHYLNQMKNDLFLGLLAYNIGPKNGGLAFIMQQYGALDFITIQPYLQQLPRDYPIRVLSQALAFRLYRQEGKLLPYEEGLNAVRIQHIGIPGL